MSDRKSEAGGGVWLGLICLVSGVAAVGHELLWTRRLLDLLGGSADAAAVTFGTFVLGTAVGAGMVPARLRGRGERGAWRAAAAAQAVCAVTTLPILFSVPLSDWVWPLLGAERVAHSAGFSAQVGLAVGLVLLPSVACGTFLPFLLAAVCGPARPMARWGAWYYGVNTLGGLAGVALVPLLLEPRAGLLCSGVLMSVLNVALAGACWASGSRAGAEKGEGAGGRDGRREAPLEPNVQRSTLNAQCHGEEGETERRGAAGGTLASTRLVLLAVFGSGALVLALEMIAFHQVSQITASSQHATVAVLGAVLLGLAAGSLLVRAWRVWEGALPAGLLAAVILALLEPLLFCRLTHGLEPLGLHRGAWAYGSQLALITGLGLLPLFVAAGTLFPLLFSRAAAARGDRRGASWGGLLLANGLGAFGGAMLAQHGLMRWAGPWFAMGFLGTGGAAVLGWVLWRRGSWVWLGLVFLGFLYAAPRFLGYARLPSFHAPGPGLTARQVRYGSDGIGVLLETAGGQRRILLNNSYGVGGSHSQRLDRMQMLLPLALHEAPKRIAALGLGAGFTAEAALLDPGVERLDALEISPLVLGLCREGFPRDRGGLFTDPRSRVRLVDGRVFIAAQRQVYDVILGDLFVPWREGLAGLYGREHFRQVRAALAEGGLYCQWVPLYQMREEEFDLIARTFLAVFPDAWLVRNSFALRNPAVAFVGRRGGAVFAAATVRQRCRELQQAAGVTSAFLRQPEGVFMHLLGPVSSLRPELGSGPLNTLNNARLGHLSAAGILRQDWAGFVGERWFGCVSARLEGSSLGGDGAGPLNHGIAAAQCWLEAERAALAGDRQATQVRVAQAIAALPASVLEDAAFAWEDLLVDVPLPIPRHYRRPAP